MKGSFPVTFPLKGKRVILTGGSGFLGSHLVKRLEREECAMITIPRKASYDLRKERDVIQLFRDHPADVVIHLAAAVGGIGANAAHPGSFFYDNLMMGALLMEHARRQRVQKFVAIGTVCAYPKFAPTPFKETDLWNGYPEETNAPYGLAKKMMLVQAQAYRQEYGFNAIYLLPVNLYGPGDNFNPNSSHVIPALIRKCVGAKERNLPEMEVWGTGRASREFLYVEDAAEAIALATLRYNGAEPVNIGSGKEIRVRELVKHITHLCGYKGKIFWDKRKPDGQPRRWLDTRRAEAYFGFQASTPFLEGLRQTIAWYLKRGHKLISSPLEGEDPPMKNLLSTWAGPVRGGRDSGGGPHLGRCRPPIPTFPLQGGRDSKKLNL